LEMRCCFLSKLAWTMILLFYTSCHHWVIYNATVLNYWLRWAFANLFFAGNGLKPQFSCFQSPN
jgi:hypothetical protein